MPRSQSNARLVKPLKPVQWVGVGIVALGTKVQFGDEIADLCSDTNATIPTPTHHPGFRGFTDDASPLTLPSECLSVVPSIETYKACRPTCCTLPAVWLRLNSTLCPMV
jgi:hypothetical protein